MPEPHASGFLHVSELHDVYWEESGNPRGKPVVFIHGGPGDGTNPNYRRFFDPTRYRIVLFDQRGCGKSTPYAEIRDNTTWDLVGDMERIRTHLGIERWQVFGGSWGSSLGLAYAEKHPERVTEMVLRGIFLVRRSELLWFYQEGASEIFPDIWEMYEAAIPPEERGDYLAAYQTRLTSPDPAIHMPAAKAWSAWEGSTAKLIVDRDFAARFADESRALGLARIECHYFANGAFLETEDQLLRDVGRIRHIPATIVQGRYDVICPARSAWDLHRAWPEAELMLVPDAGHSALDPANTRALVAATDKYAR
ncbi:MAG TPA: prolyl aminopeptidase [Candidatus Acidoferrum sp.]|nr:prolyl aminopeptidase [Candidatus Acidoferrum sp.]